MAQYENEVDPFKDYGLFDSISDLSLWTLGTNMIDAGQHSNFPTNIARELKSKYKELGDTRIDRGLLDMAINFAGGYDWAARDGVSQEAAKDMARHYQARAYDERPNDSINDYYENVAGVELAGRTTDRLSNSDLMALAVQYAKDRYSKQAQAGN